MLMLAGWSPSPLPADRHRDVVWAYADAMNAWYIGAVGVLALTIAFAVALPDGCDDALLGCDGIHLVPIVPLFGGAVLAAVLGIIGFVRSTR